MPLTLPTGVSQARPPSSTFISTLCLPSYHRTAHQLWILNGFSIPQFQSPTVLSKATWPGLSHQYPTMPVPTSVIGFLLM